MSNPPYNNVPASLSFSGPDKPASPEADVIHHIAPGESSTPEQKLRQQLARRGLKFTNERREVLTAVMRCHEHFDVDRLYNQLREAGSGVSKATVYRTIALLCECGIAREVFHLEQGAYYEHVYGHEHHEHMICLATGKVIEFISRNMERLLDDACRAHGFHPVRHHLQVFGYSSDVHPCGANFPPAWKKPRRPRTAEGDPAFPGPHKPEQAEDDVIHLVAEGETRAPEEMLKRQLARSGKKYTSERREILKTVMSTHKHFDADWLYTKLRTEGSKVSKATVYRTIALLCECGIAREVFRNENGSFYEHVYGHEHHEHMICLKSGKVIEFSSPRMEDLLHQACRAHGFHAVRHHLQVFGYSAEVHPCAGQFPPRRDEAAAGA